MLSVKTNKEVTEFKSDFMGGFGFFMQKIKCTRIILWYDLNLQ